MKWLFSDSCIGFEVGKIKKQVRIGFPKLPTLKRCDIKITPITTKHELRILGRVYPSTRVRYQINLLFIENTGKRYSLKWHSAYETEDEAVERAFSLALAGIKIKKGEITDIDWSELTPTPVISKNLLIKTYEFLKVTIPQYRMNKSGVVGT